MENFLDFKRSPRMFQRVEKSEIQIQKPTEKKKMGKESVIEIIVPPLIMAGITAAMGILMGRGIYVLVAFISAVMTAIFSVIKFFREKRECKRENINREQLYDEYLLRKRKEIYREYSKEEASYQYHFPKMEVLEKKVSKYDKRIYEKTYTDDDFLVFSIGNTLTSPLCNIKFDEQNPFGDQKDEMYKEVSAIKQEYRQILKPVSIDLKNENLGLVGEERMLREQIQLMLMQLAVFHSYHEMEVVFIYNEKEEADFHYLKWLPHLKIHAVNVLGCIHNDRVRDQVLGSVYQILQERKKKEEEEKKDKIFLPHFVFVIEEPKLILEHPIMEFLESTKKSLGYSVIYATTTRGSLPENIDTIVLLETVSQGKLLMREKLEVNQPFELHRINRISMEWMARNLSALNHIQGMQNHIPENITFFELYKIERPEELQVKARWAKNHSEKSLAVPLGVRGKEDYVCLNLHEKAHGPHGLVAGTTGSGKSEIVQSYILSLAVNFHPYEVGFLLIDYKGGGMASLFQKLPHLLGTITNLDGSESMRALVSIKSELARRQRIFNEYGVNHINGYNRLFREGKAQEPLPHLFLISDEFAELKKEQPEFMQELVSAARIGRSLGIHLILATQKPAGVVDDQIWSNSKFKLALKVQNESDSKGIIKTPDAAYIVQPGRAYLQVGNNEIYELFQSAWSGAAYKQNTESDEIDDRIYRINDLGQGELINEDLSDEEAETGNPVTQLDATVEYIAHTAQEMGLVEVRRPWLPPLPDKLVSSEKIYQPDTLIPDLHMNLGMADIPEEQNQEPFTINLAKDGNVFFAASSGYGKTVFLTTAALSLALKNQVESLNLYILDFGNSGLIPLNRLHHTADYITFEDKERLQKFIAFLEKEMKIRRKLLADAMSQNFEVYNQSEKMPMKAIVIFLDNYDVVRELGPEVEDFFKRLSRDGVGLGIFMLVTATRSAAMKLGTINNFKNRIAGFLFESAEVSGLIGRTSLKQSEKKGRVLAKYKGDVHAIQINVMTDYEDETDYNRKLAEFIGSINSLYPDTKAVRIAVLPETLNQKELMDYEGNCHIRLGLHKETVKAMGMERENTPFVILGEARRGKTTVLKVILEQLETEAKVYLFDSQSMELYSFKEQGNVNYISETEDIESFINVLEQEITARNEQLKKWVTEEKDINPKELAGRFQPFYIVADDWDYVVERTQTVAAKLTTLLNSCAGVGISLIVTAASTKMKGFDSLTKVIKVSSNGLLIGNQGSTGMFPVRSMRELPEMGDGLLFKDGSYERLRLPKYE